MNLSNEGTKIKRTFMKDEAYQTLRKWIITGKLPPGTKLRDQELSETLGISRTPIREALLMLENEGLVETKANRWTLVSQIDLSKVEDIYAIVWTLESLAMEIALPRFSTADVEELARLNEKFDASIKTGDRDAAVEVDHMFHGKIIQIAGNEELHKLIASLKVKIQRVETHYFSQKEFMQTSYEEHQRIIEAIKKQDLKQAVEAIKGNWINSWNRLYSK